MKTYESSGPRRSPERFVKHPHFDLIDMWWGLRLSEVVIVVPCDIIHFFDAEIVHRVEYDNPHYMVSRISCTWPRGETPNNEGEGNGPTCRNCANEITLEPA